MNHWVIVSLDTVRSSQCWLSTAPRLHVPSLVGIRTHDGPPALFPRVFKTKEQFLAFFFLFLEHLVYQFSSSRWSYAGHTLAVCEDPDQVFIILVIIIDFWFKSYRALSGRYWWLWTAFYQPDTLRYWDCVHPLRLDGEWMLSLGHTLDIVTPELSFSQWYHEQPPSMHDLIWQEIFIVLHVYPFTWRHEPRILTLCLYGYE